MGNSIEYIERSGLLDVVKEWIKTERYITVWKLKEAFTIDEETAITVFSRLIEEGLIAKEKTYDKGNLVKKEAVSLPFKIYIIDINPDIVSSLKKEFLDENGVVVLNEDFAHFMDTHPDVDCIVSPGNSFGMMDGGYDKAIINYFGTIVEKAVQKRINDDYYGEQPVGTSLAIDIPGTSYKLIHTPTMRLPSPIKDPFVIYQCMRVTLMEAIRIDAKSILLPAFGGATGKVGPVILAKEMKQGYVQIVENLESKKV